MLLQIAPLYAAILAVIFLVYTMRVIKARSAAGLSILHGDDMDLALKVRIHANFAEFVPFALIVLMLAEMSGGNGMAVHVAGALLVASRILIRLEWTLTGSIIHCVSLATLARIFRL